MVTVDVFGVQWSSNQNIRVKLDININDKVERLKIDAAEKLKCSSNDLLLTYCGRELNNDELIAKYGIKQGSTVQAFKKIVKPDVIQYKELKESDIQQLATAFKTFKLSANYRTALQRLSRPEVIQNIIASTPQLKNYLEAIAIIQDPDLLVQLTDIQILRKVIQKHPILADVANHIAASIHEEAANINPNLPGPSSGYSYSLESLSDDDMDSSSSDGPLNNQQPITSAQVAAALANAQLLNNVPSVNNPSNRIITNEMFNSAMQQVFGSISSSNETSGTPTVADNQNEESIESITRRLAPQLNQMRELGLTDLVINVQALQATNGDVQAAIELVFSGVLSPSM